jgi:hypothetical protein
VNEQKHLLFKYNENKPSSARFASHFANDYKHVGTFGFNVWEKNDHCKYMNPKSHREETCCGIDAAEGCTLKFMSYEASV